MQFKVFYFHQYVIGEEITGMVFVLLRQILGFLFLMFKNATSLKN